MRPSQIIKLKQRQLEKDNRHRPPVLTQFPREKWPVKGQAENMVRVWLSSKFMVQVFDEGNDVKRVSVNRTSIKDNGDWDDRISWDELMQIKREIGFAGMDAVEILPADEHIVNVANMRHIWILPIPLPFGWRK